jgi:Zn-dependent protease
MFLKAACSFGAYKTGNEVMAYMGIFFLYAASININLAVFNLLPVPPLDGSRLATALLPSKYYYKIMQYERYIMIGLMALLFLNVLDGPLYAISDFVFSGLNEIASFPLEIMFG